MSRGHLCEPPSGCGGFSLRCEASGRSKPRLVPEPSTMGSSAGLSALSRAKLCGVGKSRKTVRKAKNGPPNRGKFHRSSRRFRCAPSLFLTASLMRPSSIYPRGTLHRVPQGTLHRFTLRHPSSITPKAPVIDYPQACFAKMTHVHTSYRPSTRNGSDCHLSGLV